MKTSPSPHATTEPSAFTVQNGRSVFEEFFGNFALEQLLVIVRSIAILVIHMQFCIGAAAGDNTCGTHAWALGKRTSERSPFVQPHASHVEQNVPHASQQTLPPCQ